MSMVDPMPSVVARPTENLSVVGRRGFLKVLLGSAAALTLDPERLLWVPGARTFFLPSPRVLLPESPMFFGLLYVCDDGIYQNSYMGIERLSSPYYMVEGGNFPSASRHIERIDARATLPSRAG